MSVQLNVSRAEKESHDLFIRLFLQAERELLRYVMVIVPNPADAQDILQNAAVALWNKFDQYDVDRPFVAWAYRFALNEAKLFARGHARRQKFLADDVQDLLIQERIETRSELSLRHEHLASCLERLAPHTAAVVRARYYDGRNVAEIASGSSKSEEAIYKMLQRARLALQECIENQMTGATHGF